MSTNCQQMSNNLSAYRDENKHGGKNGGWSVLKKSARIFAGAWRAWVFWSYKRLLQYSFNYLIQQPTFQTRVKYLKWNSICQPNIDWTNAWRHASGSWELLTGFPKLYSNSQLILKFFSSFLSTTSFLKQIRTRKKLWAFWWDWKEVIALGKQT